MCCGVRSCPPWGSRGLSHRPMGQRAFLVATATRPLLEPGLAAQQKGLTEMAWQRPAGLKGASLSGPCLSLSE